MNNKVLVLICLSFIVACKSKKSAEQSNKTPKTHTPHTLNSINAEQTILSNIDANINNFEFYQAKANASYQDDKQSVNLDITIMMEKGKYIWMSATALLGIEVARVLITPDSVQILNRLQRQYICTDFGYIQRMTNVPLKLENLQNMIVGNTIFNNSVQKSEVDTVLNALAVYTALDKQRQNTFYTPKYKAQRTIIEDRTQNRELKITYNGYSNFGLNTIPNNIDINIRAEKNVQCKFELSNFVWDKKREPQFSVPSSYEVIRH
jgi:hypothetical protein